ncbi:MAG: glycosyltransferase family 4 protein [Longimicrobiales bacterium]
MRVGFDVSVIRHGMTNGTAVYAYNLAAALLRLEDAPELRLFFGARASAAAEAALARLEAAGATVVRGGAPWRWSPDGAWWLPLRPRMRRFLDALDVFHAGEFFLPAAVGCACVATVHDLTTLLFPEQHALMNRRLHARRLRWIERRADRVIAVSDHTRDDLLRLTGLDPGRVERVYEARASRPAGDPNDDRAILRTLGLEGRRYVLAVGTIEPRKNHARLIGAFERIERADDMLLVLVGGWGWRCAPVRRAIQRSSARDRIRVLGSVPGETLGALYRGAAVFAFPSLYEGFGLPVLEAMAAGAPVLTSNTSSLAEIAGDAALLIDPLSVESIAAGLERLMGPDSPALELAARGVARERRFTWRQTAERTLDVYRLAAGAADPKKFAVGGGR